MKFTSDFRAMTEDQQERLAVLAEADVTIGTPAGLDEDGNGTPHWRDWRWSQDDIDLMEVYVEDPTLIDAALEVEETEAEGSPRAAETADERRERRRAVRKENRVALRKEARKAARVALRQKERQRERQRERQEARQAERAEARSAARERRE